MFEVFILLCACAGFLRLDYVESSSQPSDLSAQVLELAKQVLDFFAQVPDLSAQLPDLWKKHITPFHIRNFSKLNCPYRTTISSVNTHPPRSAGMA